MNRCASAVKMLRVVQYLLETTEDLFFYWLVPNSMTDEERQWLPDNQRIAFTLHKLEGQSYMEIAEIMNTSLYAVESLMSRAKANLKKQLNKYYSNNNQ